MLSFIFFAASPATILFFGVLAYQTYARYKLSPKGGNLQAQIRELLLEPFDWDGEGEALDIGCGNGPLTIAVAKKFSKAHVTGIDYWGGRWEYSKRVCEHNAEVEGVGDRVTFQKASASALPFNDESFDAAVSNFVFHEVSDVSDKREVIKESLRVVKKGGAFAFQDYFLRKRVYGDFENLLETIRSWGVSHVEFIDTSGADFIPVVLRLPFALGVIGVLYGRK
jgi:SAM-dependent methyltransferase